MLPREAVLGPNPYIDIFSYLPSSLRRVGSSVEFKGLHSSSSFLFLIGVLCSLQVDTRMAGSESSLEDFEKRRSTDGYRNRFYWEYIVRYTFRCGGRQSRAQLAEVAFIVDKAVMLEGRVVG